MRAEDECKPSQRYLFSDEIFTDNALEQLKKECIKRCKNILPSKAYERYIN